MIHCFIPQQTIKENSNISTQEASLLWSIGIFIIYLQYPVCIVEFENIFSTTDHVKNKRMR